MTVFSSHADKLSLRGKLSQRIQAKQSRILHVSMTTVVFHFHHKDVQDDNNNQSTLL